MSEKHVDRKVLSLSSVKALSIAEMESNTASSVNISLSRESSSQDCPVDTLVTTGSVEGMSSNRESQQIQPAVPKLKTGETGSEAEDLGEPSEIAEEDAFLFRQMGKKFKTKLSKFAETHFSTSKNEIGAPQDILRLNPVMEHIDDYSILFWSAFRVPAYRMERDEFGRLGVPIILSLVKVLRVIDYSVA